MPVSQEIIQSYSLLIWVFFQLVIIPAYGQQPQFISLSSKGKESIPEQFQGNWVADGSVFSNQIREVRDPEFGFNYLGFRFGINEFCISYNPFETLRCFTDVVFKDDTLWVMESPMYLFRSVSKDQMDFVRINGGITQKLKRLNTQDINYEPGVLYQSQPGIHPIHKSIFSSIFFFNSLVIYPAPREDQVITIEFTVTSAGTVENIQILSSHSRLRRRWFLNSMLDSSGEWIPAMVDNKPVNCRIKLELVRVGYRTLEAEEKAWRYYNFALRQITKKDYAGAVSNLNAALVYTPGNPRLLFTRSVCHFYLKDEKKQCEDVIRARESCPFIPTAIADEELGILVECYKRQ